MTRTTARLALTGPAPTPAHAPAPVLMLMLVLALLLHPAARAADLCAGLRAGSNHLTVMSSGTAYDVALTLPASFTPNNRVPLVIGLHPSGGTGATFDQDTGLGAAATSKGFAVIFPDGGVKQATADGYFWNIPGVPLVGGSAVPSGSRDDVRFLADVIDHVVKNSCIDARRIYVTGFSGGARMSSMVACRLADRVHAIAPVAGLRAGRAAGPDFTEPEATDCRPSRPLSVLAIHGTDDPTNPFPGGGDQRWGYSVERAVTQWASLDRCSGTSATEKIATQVTRIHYDTCGSGSEVALYRIDAARDQGGGHIWPGGHRDLATRGSSASSIDSVKLDATQLVLEFFSHH
jgi:polyhydroxybutyrate depolymerase